jgi:hypothetical protein
MHIIFTAHRPMDMHVLIRSLADHWFVFQLTEDRDLEVIGKKSARLALAAEQLGEHHYAHWDDSTRDRSRQLEINRRPSSWETPLTVDGARATIQVRNPASKPENVLTQKPLLM